MQASCVHKGEQIEFIIIMSRQLQYRECVFPLILLIPLIAVIFFAFLLPLKSWLACESKGVELIIYCLFKGRSAE